MAERSSDISPEAGPRAGFARRAIVGELDSGPAGRQTLRQMSVERFGDAESRIERRDPHFSRGTSMHTAIATQVISTLLKPTTWKPPAERAFDFSPHELVELCEHAEAVLRDEPTLLELSVPIKIFGDIHGQYPDLMRLFAEFGAPSHVGDLDLVDYLFLGDFVDRGAYQLETICLVLALKIEYPDRVFLIRGNHEAPEINEKYGFRDECIERLGPAGDAVWRCFNAVFAWLPLAATIAGKIFCVHGGLGLTIQSLDQVARIERPIERGEGALMMDLLWSDPAAHDSIEGVQLNQQRLGIDSTDRPPQPGECVTFDAARVAEFCKNNAIHLIVRAHECVMDGFEKFASGRLVTVFSASRYCNTYENAGAILVVDRSLTVIPKLLRPSPATHYGWHNSYTDRPPTPPRNPRGTHHAAGAEHEELEASVGDPINLRKPPGHPASRSPPRQHARSAALSDGMAALDDMQSLRGALDAATPPYTDGRGARAGSGGSSPRGGQSPSQSQRSPRTSR